MDSRRTLRRCASVTVTNPPESYLPAVSYAVHLVSFISNVRSLTVFFEYGGTEDRSTRAETWCPPGCMTLIASLDQVSPGLA